MVGTAFQVTTKTAIQNQAKQKQKQNRFLRHVVMTVRVTTRVQGLAARTFRRLELNFFLDSPFIEPRYGTDLVQV
jgi:hypothetical protein